VWLGHELSEVQSFYNAYLHVLIPSCSFVFFFNIYVYGCVFCILLFNSVSYVLLLLCMVCSVYSVFIVPTGILRLTRLRLFRAFSSVVRQMPGYNS